MKCETRSSRISTALLEARATFIGMESGFLLVASFCRFLRQAFIATAFPHIVVDCGFPTTSAYLAGISTHPVETKRQRLTVLSWANSTPMRRDALPLRQAGAAWSMLIFKQ